MIMIALHLTAWKPASRAGADRLKLTRHRSLCSFSIYLPWWIRNCSTDDVYSACMRGRSIPDDAHDPVGSRCCHTTNRPSEEQSHSVSWHAVAWWLALIDIHFTSSSQLQSSHDAALGHATLLRLRDIVSLTTLPPRATATVRL